MKIASLLPSATEIVCVLGLEKNLVGISHECDFPPSVAQLPRLTASHIDPRAPSREIHESVEQLVRNAVSVYDLNLDLLRKTAPDILVTQDLCDVCAVSFDQVQDACKKYFGSDITIVTLKPNNLDDIWRDIERVARATNAEFAYQSFRRNVGERITSIRSKISSANPPAKHVLTIEWMDPVMIGGLWVPEMIEIVGGNYLLASPGERALKVTREALEAINPDVVIVKPCGFKLEQTLAEINTLKKAAPWEEWNAAKNEQVYLVDGNSYFNRPGPRIIDSLEVLAFCVHPELFPEFYDTYRSGWVRLGPDFYISSEA